MCHMFKEFHCRFGFVWITQVARYHLAFLFKEAHFKAYFRKWQTWKGCERNENIAQKGQPIQRRLVQWAARLESGITMMIRMMVAVWYMGKRNDHQKKIKITGITGRYWILRRWHVYVARWSLPTVFHDLLRLLLSSCNPAVVLLRSFRPSKVMPCTTGWNVTGSWGWGPKQTLKCYQLLYVFFFRKLYFCGV